MCVFFVKNDRCCVDVVCCLNNFPLIAKHARTRPSNPRKNKYSYVRSDRSDRIIAYVRGLRYKLRMMGIPCEGPTYVYGDNQSVLFNTTIPESTLKKKTQSIAYHFVREGSVKDEWRTATSIRISILQIC
jgi:hypothetical protein